MAFRAQRYLPLVLLASAFLILFPNGASAGRRAPTPPDPTFFAPAGCESCADAAKRCYAQCANLGKAEARGCAAGCENAAATCRCDEAVTLRSEDVAPFPWPNLNKAACHSTTTCGAPYTSCASWSSYAFCGDNFCGFGLNCGEDCPECPEVGPCHCPGDATRRYKESFRVCFDSSGNSCTEWQLSNTLLSCGC